MHANRFPSECIAEKFQKTVDKKTINLKTGKKKEKWVSDIRPFDSNSDHLKKTETGLQGSEEK